MTEITNGTITEFNFKDGQYGYLQKNEPLKFINIGEETSYIQTRSNNLQHDVTISFYESWTDTWSTRTVGPSSAMDYGCEIPVGEYVLIKGENEYISSGTSDYFRILPQIDKQSDIKIEGSLMSLLGEYVRNIPCNYCFVNLFAASTSGNDKFTTLDVTGLKLDAHKVMPYCYYQLFKGQANLVEPVFPPNKVWVKSMCVSFLAGTGVEEYEIEFTANDLGQLQYFSADCANLTKAKITAHSATTRQEFAYMFRNCNSLTEVILDCEDFDGQDVCKNMFQGVTSTGVLYVRPELVDNEVINAAIPETWRILPIGQKYIAELELSDDVDEQTMYKDVLVGNLTITRNFTANYGAAIVLPCDLNDDELTELLGEGYVLQKLTSFTFEDGGPEGTIHNLTANGEYVHELVHGYPYYVEATKDIDKIELHDKIIDMTYPTQPEFEDTVNGFKLTVVSDYSKVTYQGPDRTIGHYIYGMSGGGYKYINKAGTLKGFRNMWVIDRV